MSELCMFSVSQPTGRLYAIVPLWSPRDALSRLRNDDPVWQRTDVYFHWRHRFDANRARVRLRDRIKFWFVSDPQHFPNHSDG